jgi:hypothetical protein
MDIAKEIFVEYNGGRITAAGRLHLGFDGLIRV